MVFVLTPAGTIEMGSGDGHKAMHCRSSERDRPNPDTAPVLSDFGRRKRLTRPDTDVDTMILSPEDHDQFIEQGYLVLRRLIPPDVVADALDAFERGIEDTPAGRAAINRCTTDRMLDAIGELFGSDYSFTRRQGGHNMKRPYEPEAEWNTPVAHVDDSYPTIMPGGWAVGSFIFLTPVRSHGGAFIYFPGSYLRYRQVMAEACHCVKGAAAEIDYSGPYREHLAEPGDVLLFHHLGGHCGSTNVVDPQTRHALLNRWHPDRRIVPGDKPFDRMSSIEKVNSARYMSDRFGMEMHVQGKSESGLTHTALRDGIDIGNRVRTCAVIHFSGKAHLFSVDEAAPSVIRHQISDDFLTWRDAGTVPVSATSITALQIHQYTLEVVLAVTDEASNRTDLYLSEDLVGWTRQSTIDGMQAATPWYIYANYPSKIAGGQSVYSVSGSEPDTVVCRWGKLWADAGQWDTRSTAVRSADGAPIHDITVAAYMGDSQCAILADVGDGETRPHYVMPKDIAVAEAPLQPLRYETPTSPRRIRVFNRARGYWLVAYIRSHQGKDRLFWGVIDWTNEDISLKELSAIAAFNEAIQITGFV